MSRADTWMPLNVGDYLADTMHLNAAQHGAYLLLIMHYWCNGPLPDDDTKLANITRTKLRAWNRDIGSTIRTFFFKGEDSLLHQKRCDEERAKAAEISQKRRAAGALGGSKCLANAQAKPKHSSRARVMTRGTVPLPLPVPVQESPPTPPRGDRARNGTRIPPDWKPSPADRQYALEHGVDQDLAAEEFRNYWLAVPGQKGTKLDWSLTFRNRVVELQERGRFPLKSKAVLMVVNGKPVDPRDPTLRPYRFYE